MRISENIYIVGSSSYGLSHDFDCNIYVVDYKDQMVMIDSGAGVEPERIIKNIKADGLDPQKISMIMLTHSHSDHAGGCRFFSSKLGAGIYISNIEADIVEKGGEKELALDIAKASGLYSPDYSFSNCRVSQRLKDRQKIDMGDIAIESIHTAGHSKGSLCYLADLPEGRVLFTGDTVFPGGSICVLNCNGSSLADYRGYLKKLSGLGIDILLPGHSVFTLKNGQDHIDMAVTSLGLLSLPKNFL